jgi:hypothetical protein
LRFPVVCLIFHSSVVTDEPRTLSYQITLFGPIGADVRQMSQKYSLIKLSLMASMRSAVVTR